MDDQIKDDMNKALDITEQLSGDFKFVLGSRQGQNVLKAIKSKLRIGLGADFESGAELTYAECAYHNCALDIWNYISTMMADDNDLINQER